MLPHSLLMDSERSGTPPPIPVYDNPNHHLSTNGMLITLGINLAVFIVLVAVFEVHRFYKQIYLKRLQKRFEVHCSFSLICHTVRDSKSQMSMIFLSLRSSHHIHFNYSKSQPSSERLLAHSQNITLLLRHDEREYSIIQRWYLCDERINSYASVEDDMISLVTCSALYNTSVVHCVLCKDVMCCTVLYRDAMWCDKLCDVLHCAMTWCAVL